MILLWTDDILPNRRPTSNFEVQNLDTALHILSIQALLAVVLVAIQKSASKFWLSYFHNYMIFYLNLFQNAFKIKMKTSSSSSSSFSHISSSTVPSAFL